jgi:hypothetical protein
MNDRLSNLQEAKDLAKLQAQMQRPAQTVHLDGGFELGWGTAIVCCGLVPYLNAMLPRSVWTSGWTGWIGFLPLACAAFAPYGIPKIIKRFITWPRTGYVVNPNDVTLIQLVMLMGFGLALGLCLTMPFILASEIRDVISHPGAQHDAQAIMLHSGELLVCATLAVYLARKTLRKRRPPLPTAYDSLQIKHRFAQTASGRKVLRGVKLTLLLLFLGTPVLAGALVFGLIYLVKSVTSRAELSLPQIGVVTLFVATNALLYLMCNAVAIKRYRWKWLVLALMVLGPMGMGWIVPWPAVQPQLTPVVQLFPPQAMLSIGFAWCLSGIAALILFVRHHPLPAADAA